MTSKRDPTRTRAGIVLMRYRCIISLRDLLERNADLLRNGGADLHRAFIDRYAPHNLDLLLIELDLHAQRLRRLTTPRSRSDH
jgi:hypothetical protein